VGQLVSSLRDNAEGYDMKPTLKRTGVAVFATLLLLSGCATHPGMQRGMDTFGRGMANLILSPVMIVGGLAQGLAFLPYTIGMGLDDFNRALRDAQAVTMDDAYRATFKVASIADPRVDQKTGEVAGENFGFGRYRPEAMLEATHAFQRLLVSQGMPEEKSRHYVVVGDYSQTRARGHVLIAVVYRHTAMQPFRVTSKQTGIVTTLHADQMGWRQPYERDVRGQPIDEVIDWVGIEYATLKQDRLVATLMVLGAESVKSGKRSPDYWEVERRWAAGGSAQVMAESSAKVRHAVSPSYASSR
jgi:hypothetical protein